MAATINASTSAGVVTTADTSGNLNLQSNGTTIIGYTSAGATVTGALTVTKSGNTAALITQTGATGYGLIIVPGADTVYDAFTINNAANTLNKVRLYGDGSGTFAGGIGIGGSASPGTSGLAVTGTLSATGNISLTKATGVPQFALVASTGTNEGYLSISNTGGTYYYGVENSAGSWFGASAYAMARLAPAGKVIQDLIAGSPITTVASTGLAVTGGLSVTGELNLPTGGTSKISVGGAAGGPGNVSHYSATFYADPTAAVWGITMGQSSVAANSVLAILNNNGIVGGATTAGSATTWGTSSDVRRKDDKGVATSTDVLKNSVVHNFNWKVDQQPDIGVFAQEAYLVKPTAVHVGGDDLDDQGRLASPWMVDYSKYVPDLIVGWQQHQSEIDTLKAQIESLTARIAALEAK